MMNDHQPVQSHTAPGQSTDLDFRGDTQIDTPIHVAPLHHDRRIELLMLGLQLGKSDAEMREQLRNEGLDSTLPANYRTEQGELDLLKHWRA
ncbi:MAG TPA: hypothetical protein VHD63_21295 [Ktedonobacteraceae bacterium]|jgi:hypothetical protein|nr:hypothetical protein [Ktedonobacteraceae bacterium]